MVISYTQQNSTSRNLDISKIKLKTTDKSLQLAPQFAAFFSKSEDRLDPRCLPSTIASSVIQSRTSVSLKHSHALHAANSSPRGMQSITVMENVHMEQGTVQSGKVTRIPVYYKSLREILRLQQPHQQIRDELLYIRYPVGLVEPRLNCVILLVPGCTCATVPSFRVLLGVVTVFFCNKSMTKKEGLHMCTWEPVV